MEISLLNRDYEKITEETVHSTWYMGKMQMLCHQLQRESVGTIR